MTGHMQACDDYLAARTGCYEYRSIRYAAASSIMAGAGLTNDDTVIDVGAGWTEFDYHLRTALDWRGRYVPIDGWVDDTDIDSPQWAPPRRAEWIVALEVIEHVWSSATLVAKLVAHADRGVVLSTPNPDTTDVLGMDPTHVSIIHRHDLERWGFTVEARQFYGQPDDSLFAYRLTS